MLMFNIPKSRLIKPIGRIVEGRPSGQYKNVVNAFAGDIPVIIETDMSQEEFDKFSEGRLTKEDIESFKERGIF